MPGKSVGNKSSHPFHAFLTTRTSIGPFFIDHLFFPILFTTRPTDVIHEHRQRHDRHVQRHPDCYHRHIPKHVSLSFLVDHCKWLHTSKIGGAADLIGCYAESYSNSRAHKYFAYGQGWTDHNRRINRASLIETIRQALHQGARMRRGESDGYSQRIGFDTTTRNRYYLSCDRHRWSTGVVDESSLMRAGPQRARPTERSPTRPAPPKAVWH